MPKSSRRCSSRSSSSKSPSISDVSKLSTTFSLTGSYNEQGVMPTVIRRPDYPTSNFQIKTTFYGATLCVSAVIAVGRCHSVRQSICSSVTFVYCIQTLKMSSNFFFGPVAPSLPARRRPQGLVVIGVCVSVSVCLCALFCPQDISRTGSWITTKFGGWEQGVNL